MSLNINIKTIAFLSLVILLTDAVNAQKTIDPARQLDPKLDSLLHNQIMLLKKLKVK